MKSDLKLFRRTDLESLYKICRIDDALLKEIDYCIDPNPLFEKYHNQEDFFKAKSESNCLHEAGFDAFMTGVAFMCMTKHKELIETLKKNTSHKNKNNSKKNKKQKPKKEKPKVLATAGLNNTTAPAGKKK